MSLLLCYIHTSNIPSKEFDIVTSNYSVKHKAVEYEKLIKEISNFGPELKKDVRIMREISAVKDEKKVSQQLLVNNELKGTGNYSPAAAASRHEPIPLSPIAVAMQKAAARESVAAPKAALQERPLSTISLASSKADAQDKPVTHPASSVLTSSPALSQAEAKPDPVTVQVKITAGHKDAPSLLSIIKHQFEKTWSAICHYFTLQIKEERLAQQEEIIKETYKVHDQIKEMKIVSDIRDAYSNKRVHAIDIFNTEIREELLDEIESIKKEASIFNVNLDHDKLCKDANDYANKLGGTRVSFILTANGEIVKNGLSDVLTARQRISIAASEIMNNPAYNISLRRATEDAEIIIGNAYNKFFSEFISDKENHYDRGNYNNSVPKLVRTLDRNEMRAALLEGQPALAVLRTSSAA